MLFINYEYYFYIKAIIYQYISVIFILNLEESFIIYMSSETTFHLLDKIKDCSEIYFPFYGVNIRSALI